jgi:hypothetical protein
MADDLHRRLDMTERNQSDLARTVTGIVQEIAGLQEDVHRLKTNEEINKVREESRDEWRKRTESKLDGIYRLGWWVLTTFGGLTLAALANILFGGRSIG